MTPEERAADNDATYLRLRRMIDQTYPKGRIVAIDGGRVIADAATYEEVEDCLLKAGHAAREILVAEAGMEYPEWGHILGMPLHIDVSDRT